MALPAYIFENKERYMTEEPNESEQQTNKEKYALLKEFHRTLRQALTGSEYKVFCALEDWSESKGECWHSQSTIAKACDLSLRSVNAAIKELENLGLVETKETNGLTSTYIPARPTYAKIAYLRDNLRKNCTGRYANSAQPPTQKLHINVSNINGSNNNELTTPKGVAQPSQKSVTIDLIETDIDQPAPPAPPAPQTIPLTAQTSRQQVEQPATYPALPESSPLTRDKARGAGGAGGGERDIAHGKSKGKPRDERLDNPAVILYRQNCKLTPNEVQRDMIVTQVTDLGEWEKNLKYWMGAGYKPGSVDKIVDCYKNQNYRKGESNGRGRSSNDRGTGMGGPGSTRPFAAPQRPGQGPAAAPDPNHWNRPVEELDRELAAYRP